MPRKRKHADTTTADNEDDDAVPLSHRNFKKLYVEALRNLDTEVRTHLKSEMEKYLRTPNYSGEHSISFPSETAALTAQSILITEGWTKINVNADANGIYYVNITIKLP